MHFSFHLKKYFSLFALALFLYGCGVWGDFTTYFNLYYNTNHLFNEAESSIQQDRADLFATTLPKIKAGDDQKLQKVIEKCSKILQFSSDSRFVDDALLILGKSFYYQENYLKATREFDELLQTQPDSDLRLETQLWLGKSQLRLNRDTEALATLKKVREEATAQEENEILENALIEEIKYKISTDNIAGAIKSSEDFLKVCEDDDLNQKIAFELGNLNIELKNYDAAISAYQMVLDYSPSYQMELDAKLALGKAYIFAGNDKKAYTLFDDMSSLDKNKDVLDRINLEKGIALVNLDRYNDAIDVLTYVDTTYKGTKYGGAAKYEIGKIYENIYNNFDMASEYYLKTSRSVVPREYTTEVLAKIEKFRKYDNLKKELKLNSIQYEYALNPEKYIEDSTKFFDRLKELQANTSSENNATDLRNKTLELGRQRDLTSTGTGNTKSSAIDFSKPPVKPTLSSDSIKSEIVISEFELGNLFFSELNKPDSAYYYYSKVLKDNPSRDIEANTLYVLGNYFLSKNDTTKADSLFNVVYENFQDQSVVNSAATVLKKPLINLDYDPAQELYENAEKQMLNKDFDKSLAGLRNIYENFPSSPRAPKALYASGWILENELLKPDSAAEVYDTLKAKYPASEYAKNISPKLSDYHTEKERIKKAVEDSLMALNQKKDSVVTAADTTQNKLRNIPEEMLKKLPPGLRYEARRDSTREVIDERKDLFKEEKRRLPELKDEIIKIDSSVPKPKEKDEPTDTLKIK